jgi:hypothetical protein
MYLALEFPPRCLHSLSRGDGECNFLSGEAFPDGFDERKGGKHLSYRKGVDPYRLPFDSTSGKIESQPPNKPVGLQQGEKGKKENHEKSPG